MDKYKKFIETAEWSIREEPAIKILQADFPQEIVKEINDYIDDVVLSKNEDYSHHLAGQLKEDERSAQLDFPFDSGIGKELKSVLDAFGNAYVAKGFGRKAKTEVVEIWTNHAYAGDYNPFHDHGSRTFAGLSGFLWLTIPEGINPANENVSLNNASGIADGWTQLIWGTTSRRDVMELKPVTESYECPVAGRLLVFPSWLKHQVLPFFGEGERRSIAMNWAIHDSDEEVQKYMSKGELEKLSKTNNKSELLGSRELFDVVVYD
tara:strand:- start:1014 stop:1805 length:792 start_codon:yes stop_codon:yes gene_type:complete